MTAAVILAVIASAVPILWGAWLLLVFMATDTDIGVIDLDDLDDDDDFNDTGEPS